MILTIIELIAQRRNLVLSLLAIPALAIFFIANYKVEVVPPYPYIHYRIDFEVPGNRATYIEDKVTREAEKLFNGLPGLLSIESKTQHEHSQIDLVFGTKSESDKVLLFIQEKMDRLKLILPNDVSKITIDDVKRKELPDITIKNIGVSPNRLEKILEPLRDKIRSTSPEIDTEVKIRIKLNVPKMLKLSIPVDQLWKALKLEGVTYNLGKQGGVSYTLHQNLFTVEQIKNIPVGVFGNRPVRLNEVAQISVLPPMLIDSIQIKLDKERTSTSNFAKELEKSLPNAKIEKTYIEQWSSFFLKSSPILLILLIFQFVLFAVTFRSIKAITSVVIFDILLFSHYFFWIGIIRNEITIIDMAAFLLSLLIGTLFWVVLLFRIRMYFIKSKLPSFIQRTLAQASLFSIAEYLPTFIILSALSILFTLPLFISEINIPSKMIMLRYLCYGLPVTLILLSFLPILSPLNWIKDDVHLEHPSSKFNIPISTHWFWLVLICFVASLVTWYHLPVGVLKSSDKSLISDGLDSLRGHTNKLEYDSKDLESDQKVASYNKKKTISRSWMIEWQTTPTSLMNLSKYDMNDFQNSLTEIQHQRKWGVFGTNGQQASLHFDQLNLTTKDFSNIVLSPKGDKTSFLRAGLMFRPNVQLSYNQIFRSQLSRANRLSLTDNYTDGNFLTKLPENILPSARTKHWYEQYKTYTQSKWMVLIFTFILISLYMNSFLRGGLLTLTCFSVEVLNVMYKVIVSRPFHLDSLWISWLPLWTTLFIILVLSRMTDVERLRGNDRDLVLKENEQYFATVTKWSFYFIAFSLIIVALFDGQVSTINTGLASEGILIGAISIVVGLITYFYLFKLFYVAEDEFVEELTFRAMLLSKKLRRKD